MVEAILDLVNPPSKLSFKSQVLVDSAIISPFKYYFVPDLDQVPAK